jgi:quercetin dioxygenase-like cupin family protein
MPVATAQTRMAHTKVTYEDVEPVSEGLYFLRDPLDAENLGVSVLECGPGYSGMEHDHADEGQEEVYVLVEGAATVTVDGEAVAMEAGDALRIPPGATRQIANAEEESRFVLVGAP